MSNGTKEKILSIIVPALNEEATITDIIALLKKLQLPQGWSKEVIIIDDGSKDKTAEVARNATADDKSFIIESNLQNLGKSRTVKRGILMSTGDCVIIQDADTEYDVNEIPLLLEFMQKNNADAAYGNRFGKKNKLMYWSFYIGNRALSLFSNIFTFPRLGVFIPDMEVCYKLMDGKIARDIASQLTTTSTFGVEPEITARLARYKKNGKHIKLVVMPISYTPRSIEQGKKVRWTDGVKALFEIIKYNLF